MRELAALPKSPVEVVIVSNAWADHENRQRRRSLRNGGFKSVEPDPSIGQMQRTVAGDLPIAADTFDGGQHDQRDENCGIDGRSPDMSFARASAGAEIESSVITPFAICVVSIHLPNMSVTANAHDLAQSRVAEESRT